MFFYSYSYSYSNCCLFLVSTALGQYGETPEKAKDWIVGLETIINILKNILNHPTDPKFFTINPANPNFYQRFIF